VVGPANLLCLDEPTNHLDLDSRELLTDALAAYQGTVVLVTHDRELIRATADRICAVGDGTATLHDGDLDAYLAQRAAGSAAAAGAAGVAAVRANGRALATDRKQQRRNDAEARRRTQGLRNELAAAEAELEAAEQRLADLEQRLADPRTYDDPEVGRELSIAHALTRDQVAAASRRWERLVEQVEVATT
jgi:ATP-binding cassette, subfamily F, member 3